MSRIYVLIDPRSKSIRYVGLTSSTLTKRLGEHISHTRKHNTYRDKWIRNVLKDNIKPEIMLVEDGIEDKNELDKAEIFYLSELKKLGCRLTNLAEGGIKGSPGKHRRVPIGFKQTEDHKRKKVLSNPRIRPICQYDFDGNFIREFESQRQASKELKISQGNIGMVLLNIRKKASGFIFKYKQK